MSTAQPAPRIALINATPAAIGPAVQALAADFPEAEVWNILDDKLLADASSRGGLDDPLRTRMARLIQHALAEGADGILLTCSMYGPIAQDTHADVPVMAPDEAAFDELAAGNYGRVLVIASLESALTDSVARLRDALQQAGRTTDLDGVAAPAAFTATQTGNQTELADALIAATKDSGSQPDAIFLAQYSLAPATEALAAATGLPVISGPTSAAKRLRSTVK
ncbi:aspartate/glutamate racemase family protein [Arthrobacter sp. NPDC056727]|uniref:aspartate/glutamate racemase family protein n=1 Tax=Arthrobacter sp. NPDC056727 TaxID=3345927 RepID=UPI00366E561C